MRLGLLATVVVVAILSGVLTPSAAQPIPATGILPPTGLASSSPKSITALTLTWSIPAGEVVTNLTVYYSLTGGCQDSLWSGHSTGGNVSTYTITGLAGNTKYCVAVTLWTSAGQSTSAAWGNFTTLPGPVQGLSVTSVGTTSISIIWSNGPVTTATTQPIANVTIFYHSTSCSSFVPISTSGAATTWTIGSLTGGTSYCIAVCAWGPSGMTTSCGWGNFSTQGAVVSNFRVLSPYPTQIRLQWVNPSGIVVNDTVRYGVSCSAWTVVNAGVTTGYTIGGLAATHSYCVAVQAWSNEGSAGVLYTNQTTLSDPATGLSFSNVNPKGATLKWSNPTESIVNVSITYGTLSCGQVLGKISAGDVTSYVLSTLIRGVSYCVNVRTWSNGGGSNNTNGTLQTPPQLPFTAPTGLHETAQTSASVTLAWTNPSVPLSNDTIYFGPNCSRMNRAISTVVATSQFVVGGLSALTTYCWAVQAWNTTGFNSTLSSSIYASTGAYYSGPSCAPPNPAAGCTNESAASGNTSTGIPLFWLAFGLVLAVGAVTAAAIFERSGAKKG